MSIQNIHHLNGIMTSQMTKYMNKKTSNKNTHLILDTAKFLKAKKPRLLRNKCSDILRYRKTRIYNLFLYQN